MADGIRTNQRKQLPKLYHQIRRSDYQYISRKELETQHFAKNKLEKRYKQWTWCDKWNKNEAETAVTEALPPKQRKRVSTNTNSQSFTPLSLRKKGNRWKSRTKGRERSNRNRRTKLWRTKGWIYRIFLLGVEESADLGFLSFVEEWAEKRECVTDAAESAALTPWTKRSEAERGGKGWRPKQQLFSSVVEGSRATAVAPGRF